MSLKNKLLVGAATTGLVAILGATFLKGWTANLISIYGTFDFDTYVGEVTTKDRVPEQGYRISIRMEDGSIRTFRNEDSHIPWTWKTNSGDVQGSFEEGDRCQFETYGVRVPYFSIFENVTSVQCPPPK